MLLDLVNSGLFEKCSRAGEMAAPESALAGGGNLLGHAMNCAEAENKVAAIDTDNFTVEEVFRENVERDAIVGIVEDGDEHKFVCKVEIGVARGQTLLVEVDGCGHGQFFDAKLSAALTLALFQDREIFLKMRVVFVGFIFLDDGQDGSFVHETAEVVDMAVRVVTGDAVL